MLDLLAAWLLYPAVALIVCAGVGLLVERASGERLPGVLLLPLGMAGVVAITQIPTYEGATAEATLPLLVIAAAAGLYLGRGRLSRPDPWALATFVATAGLYGAPVILTGAASILGYSILGDTTIHLIGADALLTLGRDYGGLPPSSYEFSLESYYGANAYPAGGPTAAGALTSLVHLDVAWTFQPFLALLSALMGQCLYSLATPLVENRPLRAAIAFLAAIPGLSVAYAWQGSVKEVGTAFGIVLVAALIAPYLARAGGARAAIPLGVAVGAAIAIVGPAAALWIAPMMLVTFVLARFPWRDGIVFVLVAAVFGYQMVIEVFTYADVSVGVVTMQQEFGNLLGELNRLQMFGVWLTGDYRVPVTAHRTMTHVLIGFVIAGIVLGVAWLIRRRAYDLLLFLSVSALALVYVLREGSPWADGKALMIVSPAVMLAAGLGAAALFAWKRAAGIALIAIVGLGVLWTNALQYHDASPAPHDRFSELKEIGERIDGGGPTLYTEFEEFAKHFLRRGDPEGTGEGWQRRLGVAPGAVGAVRRFGFAQDIDAFPEEYVSHYRTIVLRKGFHSSRPPSIYRRTYSGDFYEIWERGPGEIRARLAAGHNRRPVTEPDCDALASLARQGTRLAYLERPANVLLEIAKRPMPRGWFVDGTDPDTVIARGAGRITGTLDVEEPGRYDIWLEVSDLRESTIAIDGRRFTFAGRLNSRGVAEHIGTIELPAGAHTATITRPGGNLEPGNGGLMRLMGPLALTPADPGGIPLRTLPAEDYRELCGRSVDWVDVLG